MITEGTVFKTELLESIIKQRLLSDRSSHRRWFTKKAVLQDFAKFTGNYLSVSLLFIAGTYLSSTCDETVCENRFRLKNFFVKIFIMDGFQGACYMHFRLKIYAVEILVNFSCVGKWDWSTIIIKSSVCNQNFLLSLFTSLNF